MRKLYIIGDSFSAPFNFNNSFLSEYVEYKGYTPKFWGDIVAESIGLETINFPMVGDNEQMLDLIIDLLDDINDNDIICIGWTSFLRFRLVKNENWQCVFPNNQPFDNISKSTIDEIIVNRESELYREAIFKRIKLICYALPKNLIINWCWESGYKFKFETIWIESDTKVHDHHWSEKGHQQFANWLIEKIKLNENVIEI